MRMADDHAIDEILETVRFLRDHAASKEDLLKFATKGDLVEAKGEIMTHVDGFAVLHQKLDAELAALQHKYDRHEALLQRVLTHLHLSPELN